MSKLNKLLGSKKVSFLAPLAGLTHSPFRRLLSDFGGYSALYSEMLSGRSLFGESFESSTFIHKREQEGKVVYQLQINNDDNIEDIVNKLSQDCSPFGIDINLGCPAPAARKKRTGARLFLEHNEVDEIISRVKSVWNGPLSIKTRLGSKKNRDWEEYLYKMCSLFEKHNIDWHTLHPRFTEDKFNRQLHYKYFDILSDKYTTPIIANGNITDSNYRKFIDNNTISGIMIGRAAIVKPWIFKKISDNSFNEDAIDYQEVWNRLYSYINEEFIQTRAIGRVKQFTTYYSQNFVFGHTLYSEIINDNNLESIYTKANTFLEKNPQRVKELKILQL